MTLLRMRLALLLLLVLLVAFPAVPASAQQDKRHAPPAAEPQQRQPIAASWIPYVFSTLAVAISGVGFYFQWIYARGAKVSLLNADDRQNSAVRGWAALPKNVQSDFPQFAQRHPGYALVRLVVLNTGDRPGFLKIESASAQVPWAVASEEDRPEMSYYTYVLAPALAVTDKLVIVRNIPELSSDTDIVVKLKVRAGGPVGRFRVKLDSTHYEYSLPVHLIRTKPSELAGDASAYGCGHFDTAGQDRGGCSLPRRLLRMIARRLEL